MKNAGSTPLFECPLHALLTEPGVPDGDLHTGVSCSSGTIMFTLLDEYLKSIDHPSMRRPEEASR